MMNTLAKFRLDGRVAIITGGAGLLGGQHAQIIAEAGGIPVLWDIKGQAGKEYAQEILASYKVDCQSLEVDITRTDTVKRGLEKVVSRYGRGDILINNAANDPKVAPEVDPA